jgi:hypothetical protein
VLALLAVTAYAAPPNVSLEQPQKFSTHDPRPYPPAGDAGGEDFMTSVDMGSLPFNDSGNLWDYTDDIDFGYGTSPDVVYHYTPTADGCVSVDLCDSDYDSMLWIVDAAMTIVAWNDDGVDCDAHQSQISWMNVYAGVLYYYVLDGWYGAAGPYVIDVFERDCPPPPECPAGAFLEGEPCLAEDYEDHLNGGWNSTPPVYQSIPCAPEGELVVVCGTTFTYLVGGTLNYRDTDCFSMTDQTETTTMTFTSYYESSGSLYIYWVDEFGAYDIPFYTHLGSRELGTITAELDITLGTWGIFQSKNGWDGTFYPCEDPEVWPYVLTIEGYTCGATPADTDTWGGVKNLFK